MSSLFPYVFAAGLLLPFAALRSWRLYHRNVDWSLALLLSCLAAAIAGSVDLGTDAAAYREYYALLDTAPVDFTWWDPGFELLAGLFFSMGAPYGLFVFVCVLASHLIKLHVFDRVAHNSLLPFFAVFCLNIGEVAFVRQHLSASLVLLSFFFLTSKRHTSAVLVMLAAASIHKSALAAIGIILLLHFRWSMLKPAALLSVIGASLLALLPTTIVDSLETRIYTQIAAYTVEGFVQGLQAADTSIFRNVAKFGLYILLAAWMLLLPARNGADFVQRKAAHIVVALSVVSVVMVALISPAFARLSAYIFPLLALSLRAERFRPTRSELAPQYVLATLLLAYLVTAIYPLRDYL